MRICRKNVQFFSENCILRVNFIITNTRQIYLLKSHVLDRFLSKRKTYYSQLNWSAISLQFDFFLFYYIYIFTVSIILQQASHSTTKFNYLLLFTVFFLRFGYFFRFVPPKTDYFYFFLQICTIFKFVEN